MIYAPVIIPTLCRYKHFVRLIESLKKNKHSEFTDVYVGLDYPVLEKHRHGYSQICKYLEGDFNEFKSFNVIKRSYNFGAGENLDDLINLISDKYDRFIKIDDDAEVSTVFLEYVNKCLELYKSDKNIIAISGYSYPLDWRVSDGASVFCQNFIAPVWGTGFWCDKYRQIQKFVLDDCGFVRDADSIVRGAGLQRMSMVCRREYADLCLSPDYTNTLAAKITDISIRMYMAACDKYVVMPVLSKVRNCGFDGTGEYCEKIKECETRFNSKAYSYDSQPIDDAKEFMLIPDENNDIKANKILMNKFDTVSLKSRVKTYLKLFLFFILGLSNYHRATLALRRLRSYGK